MRFRLCSFPDSGVDPNFLAQWPRILLIYLIIGRSKVTMYFEIFQNGQNGFLYFLVFLIYSYSIVESF